MVRMAPTINKDKDQVVLLLKAQNKSWREIGKIMNLHFTSVRNRYFRIVGIKKGGKKFSTVLGWADLQECWYMIVLIYKV